MTVSSDEFLRRFLIHVLPRAWSASATSAFLPTPGVAVCSYAAVLGLGQRVAQLILRSLPSCAVLFAPLQ